MPRRTRQPKALPDNNCFKSLPPRRHDPAQSLPNLWISGCDMDIIGQRAIVRDRVFVGHGPCLSCLRIVSAEVAERNAETEKKTGMATSTHLSTHVAAGTAKNTPRAKGPINPSQRTLRPAPRPLRLVWRTFQH